MHGIERKKNEEFKKYLKKHTHTLKCTQCKRATENFPKHYSSKKTEKKSVICAYFIFSTTKYFVNNFHTNSTRCIIIKLCVDEKLKQNACTHCTNTRTHLLRCNLTTSESSRAYKVATPHT